MFNKYRSCSRLTKKAKIVLLCEVSFHTKIKLTLQWSQLTDKAFEQNCLCYRLELRQEELSWQTGPENSEYKNHNSQLASCLNYA